MSYDNMIIGLIAVTFAIVIAWGAWQWVRTKKSQQRSGDPDGRKATAEAAHDHTAK